jgi:hypothetical protein
MPACIECYVYLYLALNMHMYAIEGKYEGYNVLHTYVWGAPGARAVEITFPLGNRR